MTETLQSITYPRKRLARGFLRTSGRLLIPILSRLKIEGKNNFPKRGPLLVVGNHVAVMEAILMNVFSPWQVEMLGAADIPHEKISQIFSTLYGFIPVNRGHIDRPALTAGLNVLKQNGVIGIFPEGGIWEPGIMKPQTGVSWLSYRGNAPVLPIGFSGMLGSLDAFLKLQRPKLVMKIGQLIQPVTLKTGVPRKIVFENFAEEVMIAVRGLILPNDPSRHVAIKDEEFELKTEAFTANQEMVAIPASVTIQNQAALSKFFHRPAILKIFRRNLQLPIAPLQNLVQQDNPQSIKAALEAVLNYLENENPYLLTYRFGPKNAEEMFLGLQELLKFTNWAVNENFSVRVTPIWKYFSIEQNKHISQTSQGAFTDWM